ncbi:MAG: hypothetical protein WDN25_11635 [Acetobacteraceae bacterium]
MRILAVSVLLAGCALVDQTTFAPAPEPEGASKPEPPKVDPRAALLTIGYAAANANYQEVLRYAVRTAETRAPGVQYDVVALLPGGSDAGAAQRRAADVMRGIMAQGVPAARIHLGLRSAPADSPQEVRVYVR